MACTAQNRSLWAIPEFSASSILTRFREAMAKARELPIVDDT